MNKLEITQEQYDQLMANPQKGIKPVLEMRYYVEIGVEESKRKKRGHIRRPKDTLHLHPDHAKRAEKLTGNYAKAYLPIVAAITAAGDKGCTGKELEDWINTAQAGILERSVTPTISHMEKKFGILTVRPHDESHE